MTRDASSDGSLLAAWRAGHEPAFGALVERHQGALLRHARALLGAHRGGEDVVQEAFLRLAKSPPELPQEGEGPAAERALVSSWLHRVTRNLCMDTLRREERRTSRERAAAPPERVDLEPGPLERADTRAAVEASLARLPADQREVLVLRLLAERSYKEIASITGKNIGTVGWLLSVGMKALAGELAPLLGMESPVPAAVPGGLRGGAR